MEDESVDLLGSIVSAFDSPDSVSRHYAESTKFRRGEWMPRNAHRLEGLAPDQGETTEIVIGTRREDGEDVPLLETFQKVVGDDGIPYYVGYYKPGKTLFWQEIKAE